MQIKKWLSVLLVLVLLCSLVPVSVLATSEGTGKLGGIQKGQMTRSFATATVNNSGRALAPRQS